MLDPRVGPWPVLAMSVLLVVIVASRDSLATVRFDRSRFDHKVVAVTIGVPGLALMLIIIFGRPR
jgi:hypothetical protein